MFFTKYNYTKNPFDSIKRILDFLYLLSDYFFRKLSTNSGAITASTKV